MQRCFVLINYWPSRIAGIKKSLLHNGPSRNARGHDVSRRLILQVQYVTHLQFHITSRTRGLNHQRLCHSHQRLCPTRPSGICHQIRHHCKKQFRQIIVLKYATHSCCSGVSNSRSVVQHSMFYCMKYTNCLDFIFGNYKHLNIIFVTVCWIERPLHNKYKEHSIAYMTFYIQTPSHFIKNVLCEIHVYIK